MVLEKSTVVQKLCQEIALITNCPLGDIDPEANLRNNGIDSMSFLEILLFIKNEWDIDYISIGLPPDAQNSIILLAEHICKSRATL